MSLSHSKVSYDVIVVGLGAVGSATLFHLALSGKKVLGIDRFHPPHSFGSSHGETRITRLAVGEGECYAPFAIRSHELWRELEKMTGRVLLTQTGGLVIEDASSGCFHGKSCFFDTTVAVAEKFGVRHELLSPAELINRFPQFAFSGTERGFYEHSAGYLHPEECIRAHLEVSRAKGAATHLGERVLQIEPAESGGVVVRTERERYEAEQVIVAAGPWISKLLPDLRRSIRVTRQVLFWFSTSDSHHLFEASRLPVFIWNFNGQGEEGMYGFPAINGPSGGMKIACSSYGVEVDPDSVQREVSSEEMVSMHKVFIERRMPSLRNTCLRTAVCLYSVTPDSDFLLGRLQNCPQIIVASPCSGHGFKHSAALGESISQLALSGASMRDLSRFSPYRFA